MNGERFIVIAEKASVARAIKSVIAAAKANAVVSSVRGHLMEADLPEGYEWGLKHPLEIIKLRNVVDKISDTKTFENLVRLFNDGGVLVVATDNDSEGELIGYEILKVYRRLHGEKATCLRMRFNSLDRRELYASWRKLEQNLNWRWVEKARFRQVFDLITGAAFTRLLTESTRKKVRVRLISWGSCQTPTLNFVVEREKEILSFKPRKYWLIKARLETEDGHGLTAVSERFWQKDIAEKVFETVKSVEKAVVAEYQAKQKTLPRPLPMRTDDVLRDLTRITGLSANKLLSIMEDLYAEGCLSYPRTDTNKYRPGFDFDTPREIIERSGILPGLLEGRKTANPRNGGKDDGAHPPIYPTAVYKGDDVKRRVWEYVARRFYANAFSEDAVQLMQHATVKLGETSLKADGSYIVSEGFYRYFTYFRPSDSPLPSLSKGQMLKVTAVKLEEDETKPPTRLSEADLLRAMEKHGIGTDATRALYPQLIVERRYARKTGRYFVPTPLGMNLIEALAATDKRLVTPETRRMVEEYMEKIEHGEVELSESLDRSLQLYETLLKACTEKIEEISSLLAESVKNLKQKALNRGDGRKHSFASAANL
ncbi:MAG: DNA topoisomerase [Candidatus Caldarchaeum sp.]|uniref:DNA topoisomerase n=1 Tax=Caldiarchaeum subterraneum TaxID=311458 RepID=A0A7C5QEL4_CALS0